MKILVSACLLGKNCKYNGKNNYSERVAAYVAGHEVIPVCPEVLGGLPTPRDPSEIVDGVVTNCKGISVVDTTKATQLIHFNNEGVERNTFITVSLCPTIILKRKLSVGSIIIRR